MEKFEEGQILEITFADKKKQELVKVAPKIIVVEQRDDSLKVREVDKDGALLGEEVHTYTYVPQRGYWYVCCKGGILDGKTLPEPFLFKLVNS